MMPSISEAWPSHHVHGHESVALLMGESSEPVPEPRERGWSDAFQAHELPPGPIVRASFSRQGGYQAALQLLTGWTRPSAIFTAVLAVLDPDSSDTYQRFATELVIRESCGCNRHE
jgi:hypothetical protein